VTWAPLRIVCISDTHGEHERIAVPPGDVLIHAGDLTGLGHMDEISVFNVWLGRLPHRHKIVIAGNHDFAFERQAPEAERLITNAIYLRDRAVGIEGLTVYGSPWQPWFYDWAFNLRRGAEIAARWARIPQTTDILVTHGPPAGHGDRTSSGQVAGCKDLLDRLGQVRPRLHVFGHIHEGYGTTLEGNTTCINASCLDLGYKPVNAPVVFDWE